MKALWSEDEATYDGEHVTIESSWAWPKPAQQPAPPGRARRRRRAEDGQGRRRVLRRLDADRRAQLHDRVGRGPAGVRRHRPDPETIELGVFNAPPDEAKLTTLAEAGLTTRRGVDATRSARRGARRVGTRGPDDRRCSATPERGGRPPLAASAARPRRWRAALDAGSCRRRDCGIASDELDTPDPLVRRRSCADVVDERVGRHVSAAADDDARPSAARRLGRRGHR